jgi:hypothetical protein
MNDLLVRSMNDLLVRSMNDLLVRSMNDLLVRSMNDIHHQKPFGATSDQKDPLFLFCSRNKMRSVIKSFLVMNEFCSRMKKLIHPSSLFSGEKKKQRDTKRR